MELLEGEDLASLLKRRNRLPPREVSVLMGELGHALAAAHAAGIVHRDLKPENIFIENPKRAGVPFTVKVLDFGIARLMQQSAATTAPVGTPWWMAPEQTQAGAAILPAADVWALGLIAYRLLTGAHYWTSAQVPEVSPMSVLREVVMGSLDLASERAGQQGLAALIPAGFDAWFGRCVVRDVSARYTEAGEATAELAKVLQGAQLAARTSSDTLDAVDLMGLTPQVTTAPIVTEAGRAARRPSQIPVAAVPEAAAPNAKGRSPVARSVRIAVVVAFIAWWFYRQPVKPTAPVSAAPIVSAKAAPLAENKPALQPVAAATAAATAQKKVDPHDPTLVWHIPIGDSPQLGPEDALVTIVEFADFQCPMSKSADAALRQLVASYKGQVRLVWKEGPVAIHQRAAAAAEFARAAATQKGTTGFWAAHDKLFEIAPDLSDERLGAAAADLGLDQAAVMKAIELSTYHTAVETDIDLADAVGLDATPTYFVNGKRLQDPMPEGTLERVVKEELAKAQALVAAGTAAAQVYQAIVSRGQGALPPDKIDVGRGQLDGPTIGGGAACVVAVDEFCDYESFFCAGMEPTLRDVIDAYDDKVMIVWHDLPNPAHPNALRAAEAAREAWAQAAAPGFKGMQAQLFEHQDAENFATLEALHGYAEKIGLNTKQFDQALLHHTHAQPIQGDLRTATAAHLQEGPVFIVGNYLVGGTMTLRSFRRVIDLVLRESGCTKAKPFRLE